MSGGTDVIVKITLSGPPRADEIGYGASYKGWVLAEKETVFSVLPKSVYNLLQDP